MNHWMFIVTRAKTDGETFAAEDIFRQRIADMFWGLGERTPNRRSLQEGDRVVFYLGLPDVVFAATAVLASDSFALSVEQKATYRHEQTCYETDYGVLLREIDVWESPLPVKDLVPRLNFIENKEYWYTYFQGGVRQLPEDDFNAIIRGQGPSPTAGDQTGQDIVSKSRFALEAHLEEFLDKNWTHIDFGSKLIRYATDDQDGRQFPAGQWSIDFLCTNEDTGDLVVVELKRGKSSDATVGQLLRYMGWVTENVAEQSQRVQGIIIAHEIDEALRYAVKHLPNVSVLTYEVDFRLSSERMEA